MSNIHQGGVRMGKKKKSNKRIKPDDFFASGNIQMARYGRRLIMKNNMTQSNHQEFTKQLADNYPQVIEKINGLVDRIVSIIQAHEPLELLYRAYWDMLFASFVKMNNDNIASDDNLPQRTLEYIQSVIVSVHPKLDTAERKISEEGWANLTEMISDMYTSLIFEYQVHRSAYLKLNDPQHNPDLEKFQVKAQMYWCSVRGDRPLIHDIPHLKRLLIPHEEVFQDLFSISVESFINEVEKIKNSLSRGVGEAFEKLAPYMACDSSGELYAKLPESQDEQEKFAEICERGIGFACFDMGQVTNLPESLLKELSWGPGEDSEFFAPGDFSGWPLRVIPIHKKPFLKIDDKYYCFEYTSFADHIYRILQKLIVRLKPEYKTDWKGKQTEVTELLPLEMLGTLLPNAQIYRPIHYQHPLTQSPARNWNECDGLLIYDDTLFIIEVKGGAFTYTSPATDFPAYISSVETLLFSPWKQSKRFYDYLVSAPEVAIYSCVDGNYQQLAALRQDQFRQIVPCAITLDNLTQLASRLETLAPLGTDTTQHPVWAVSIDDLRIYTDFFKSPLKFLHFIEERQKAYFNPDFEVDDELFHLGMYLQHNQYSSLTQKLRSSFPVLFHGYSEDIDRYYAQLQIDPETAVLPQQAMPENIEAVLKILELQGKPGRSKVASYLLAMSTAGRKQVSSAIDFILQKQIERGSYIKFSCVGEVKITLGCRIIEFMPNKDTIRDSALAEVYGNQEDKRLLLDLGYDRSLNLVNVDWEFLTQHDLPLNELDKLKALHEQEEKKREQIVIGTRKKIGRNELCPCGSNQKYKRCHGKH
jgi:hypothetical protein